MLKIVILFCIFVCVSSFVVFPLPHQKGITQIPRNTSPQTHTYRIDQDARVTNVNVAFENEAELTPALDLLPPKEIPIQPILTQDGEDKFQSSSDTTGDTSRTSKNIALPQTDLVPPKLETDALQSQTVMGETFESNIPTEAPKTMNKKEMGNDDDYKSLPIDSLPPTEVGIALSLNEDPNIQNKISGAKKSEVKNQTDAISVIEPIKEQPKELTVNENPIPIIESIFETDLSETAEVQPTESTATQNISPVSEIEILTTEQPQEVTDTQNTYNEETPSQYPTNVTVTTPSDSYYATPESVENVVRITPPTKQMHQKVILVENVKEDEYKHNGSLLETVSEPVATTIITKTEASDALQFQNEDTIKSSEEREGKSSESIPENPSSITVTTEANNIAEPITLSLDLLPPQVINEELREPKAMVIEELPKVDTPPIDLLPPTVDK